MRLTFSSMVKFQSTLPVWGATAALHGNGHRALDFNPRSPCGERPLPLPASAWRVIFQSTLPVWGATGGVGVTCISQRISIHAPRVGSDAEQECGGAVNHISIHAPRVGSDTVWDARTSFPDDFNPHSPCGERPVMTDLMVNELIFQSTLPVWGATLVGDGHFIGGRFQSTLPVWGATPRWRGWPRVSLYFNPRSPCGERRERHHHEQDLVCISIHAPRVGSDIGMSCLIGAGSAFQSTLPVWGATCCRT